MFAAVGALSLAALFLVLPETKGMDADADAADAAADWVRDRAPGGEAGQAVAAAAATGDGRPPPPAVLARCGTLDSRAHDQGLAIGASTHARSMWESSRHLPEHG